MAYDAIGAYTLFEMECDYSPNDIGHHMMKRKYN
jgi:hypothetical protein